MNFWCAALQLPKRVDKDDETIVADVGWNYPRLTSQQAPGATVGSTTVHLDVTADDREAEVKRLTELGAEPRRDVTDDGSWTWTVMADPDGNEFCVTDP